MAKIRPAPALAALMVVSIGSPASNPNPMAALKRTGNGGIRKYAVAIVIARIQMRKAERVSTYFSLIFGDK